MRPVAHLWTPMAMTLMLAGCDPHPQEKLVYPQDQKAMDAAIAEAKANLPVFWSNFDAAPSKEEYSVKVSIPTPPYGDELIWMDVTGRQRDEVSGVLVNEPVHFPGHNGDKFTAKTAQIVDWAYPKNGKFYGHFTTRVLSPQMSAAERTEAEAMMWPTALERQ
jgi:uncharacterized protein YegJ (DUF2314 family)